MAKERLNIKFLTKKGFKAFKEDEDTISYGMKDGDYYIGIEHHNWKVQSTECYADYWVLLISGRDLRLQCNCDTIEKMREILRIFEIRYAF